MLSITAVLANDMLPPPAVSACAVHDPVSGSNSQTPSNAGSYSAPMSNAKLVVVSHMVCVTGFHTRPS